MILDKFLDTHWPYIFDISYVPEIANWDVKNTLLLWLPKMVGLYRSIDHQLNGGKQSDLYITLPISDALIKQYPSNTLIHRQVDGFNYISIQFDENNIPLYVQTFLMSDAFLEYGLCSIQLNFEPYTDTQDEEDASRLRLLEHGRLPLFGLAIHLHISELAKKDGSMYITLDINGHHVEMPFFYDLAKYFAMIDTNEALMGKLVMSSNIGEKSITELQVFEDYTLVDWCDFFKAEIYPEDFPDIPFMLNIPNRGTIIFVVDEPFDSDNKKHIDKLTKFQMDLYQRGLLSPYNAETYYMKRDDWINKSKA